MRLIGVGLLAATAALLSGCGGGGAATSVTPAAAPTTATVNAYTGPAPATADVQAFEVNFWNNVRGQNRCGQCHNATTPAQMPNFARSDDVNLAYAQANTVVNLSNPSTSTIVTKVSGGHNCWLADPNACGQILKTWISNWASASTGVASATAVQLTAPPVVSVGQSLNFPNDGGQDYEQTVYTVTSVVLRAVSLTKRLGAAIPVFCGAGQPDRDRLSGGDPKDRLHGLHPGRCPGLCHDLRREVALL